MGKQNLNTIFYGPPGTGKTYRVYEFAVKLVEPGFTFANRAELMKKYRDFRAKGQIEFVTFHQSYSYEEFIEGLRPNVEDEQIEYEIEPGVLKRLVNNIKIEVTNPAKNSTTDFHSINVFKMSLGNTLKPEHEGIFEYCMDENCVALGYGEDIDFGSLKTIDDKNKCRDFIRDSVVKKYPNAEHANFAVTAVFTFIKQMRKGDLVIISKGNRQVRAIGKIVGDYEYRNDAGIPYSQFRKVDWLFKDTEIPVEKILRTNISQQTIYQISKDKILLDNLADLLSPKQNQSSSKNHVLIIDEINRGNISKIFGEAITLLDSDKRINAENETLITLPYSKELFGLPSNLFIVGTMNTADRSIALMDVALRRRFEFEEIMPDASIIRNVLTDKKVSPALISFVVNVFEILNKRIEVLYDREHQIGHSYFLDVSNESDFYNVWNKKVIPLLQEYFYNNWERLGVLLGSSSNGDGFIRSTESMQGYKGIFNDGDVEYPSQIHVCATPEELTNRLKKVFAQNG